MIAALADAQHGVVSRTQLLSAGVSRRQIQRRLQARRLRALHRGVYAVGHRALKPEGVWMAAVLAAGEGAVLSHWSAASLWRLRSGRGPRSHVTSPRGRRSGSAITFHHTRLPRDEVTHEDGIPVTTRARTLLDLAPLLPGPTLARMIDAAGASEGTTLATLLDRYPTRPGAPRLRALVGTPAPHDPQRPGGPHSRPDDALRAATPGRQQRPRDRKLTAAGWRVVRITDRAPGDAVGDLSRLLAASAARSPSRRAAA